MKRHPEPKKQRSRNGVRTQELELSRWVGKEKLRVRSSLVKDRSDSTEYYRSSNTSQISWWGFVSSG